MPDKRELILKTAYQLFSEKGFRRTRMSDIAEETGIAVGTIYQYYPTKKALFSALDLPFPAEDPGAYADKKMEIITKALPVFCEYGFEETTMDMVAAVCGISKPVLYQYFSGKEELFSAIFSEADLMKNLQNLPSLNSSLPVRNVFRQVGMKFISTLIEPDRLRLIRTALTETRRFPDIGSIIYEKAVSVVSGYLMRYLERMSAEGAICCPDPEFTSRAFLGQLFAFVVLDKLLTDRPSFDPEAVVNKTVELILFGILKGVNNNET